MDSSNKGSSPKPSLVPKPSKSGESDENEFSGNQQTGVEMHEPNKPVRHFMSHTISAASKVAVPRKKILGERNEAFSDTHLQRNPNVESRPSPLNSRNSHSGHFLPRVRSSYHSASESDDDENNAFVVDSSLRPYDPLTNYLSPRPKYLRYKPNRQHEIIQRLENERREEEDRIDVKINSSLDPQDFADEEVSSADVQDSSPPPLKEGLVKPDDEETEKKEDSDEEVEDVDEEEVEELDEEEGWSLKGIMKFLLVMFALFLSTSHILSMNLPTPSYTQQAIWRLKDGYNRIQEHLVKDDAVIMFRDGNSSQGQVEASELGAFEVDEALKEEFEEVEVELEEVMETIDEQVEMVEPIDGDIDVWAHQADEKGEVSDQLSLAENARSVHVNVAELEIKAEESSEQLPEAGIAEHDENAVDHGEASDQLSLPENAKSEHVDVGEVEVKVEEGSDKLEGVAGLAEHDEDGVNHGVEKTMEGPDLQVEESCKNHDFLVRSQTQSHSVMVDDHNSAVNSLGHVNNVCIDSVDQSVTESQVEQDNKIFEETTKVGNEAQRAEGLTSAIDDENVPSEGMQNAVTEFDASNSDNDVGSLEDKNMVIVIVVLFSTILASFGFVYRSWKTRAVREHSQPSQIRPVEKSMVSEAAAPVVPSEEEKHIEKIPKSFKKPSILFDPSNGTPKETSRILAPEVVLLGEIEIGGDISSSLRACDRKMKTIESKESNKFTFQDKKMLQMGTPSASALRQQSAVEFATTDSPSYGSFTAEKILKKEKGKDVEVKEKEALTTPVRRSSRIRNRVMSP